MNKLRNQKLGMMGLIWIWLQTGCGGNPYVETLQMNRHPSVN